MSSRPAQRRIVVVGDLLLDRDVTGSCERLCPDAPAPVLDVSDTCSGPGGAGLAALLCRRSGAAVTLVAPVADDAAGEQLRRALEAAQVTLLGLGHRGPTRTKTRIRSGASSLVRIDEGGPGTPTGTVPPAVAEAITEADVVVVSDYGAGTTDFPVIRELLAGRIGAGQLHGRQTTTIWDPHPRGASPVRGCTVLTPNLAEARAAAGHEGHPADLAMTLRRTWGGSAVCVTAGADGAWLATGADHPWFVPAPVVRDGDSCGAGDCFAATAAVSLAGGSTLSQAIQASVEEASSWVRKGGTAAYRDSTRDTSSGVATDEEASGVVGTAASGPSRLARVRREGGTIVATGGCFDVLHAGHVGALEAAGRLGDALVVLLNSDASVRRLKGRGRPVQSQADRERVLRGLRVVDEVIVFDEDDPRAALADLRPDVWAKGGDYNGSSMPEVAVMREWGGRVVFLPYLDGRSTTQLLRRHHEGEQRPRVHT